MAESLTTFAFAQLRNEKFLTLEVLMHIEHFDALKFMFSLNKETRKFLCEHFTTIENEFEN